jgi:hypothetical protein
VVGTLASYSESHVLVSLIGYGDTDTAFSWLSSVSSGKCWYDAFKVYLYSTFFLNHNIHIEPNDDLVRWKHIAL